MSEKVIVSETVVSYETTTTEKVLESKTYADEEKDQYATDSEASSEMTPELQSAEKSLLFKLDFVYVMPCIAVLNFLQFFDKSALNYSAVLGIKDDTHLTGSQFSWLGSIFYLGYLIYQVQYLYLCLCSSTNSSILY
jgi:hypothetical protein